MSGMHHGVLHIAQISYGHIVLLIIIVMIYTHPPYFSVCCMLYSVILFRAQNVCTCLRPLLSNI